jgi:hypothetical protein
MNKLLNNYLNAFVICICVSSLGACSDGNEVNTIAIQHWKDADIRVETHPNPPLTGMSEIVIIITGPRGRPIPDLIVSIRGKETVPWVQAIQDGMIGVYRRAIDIGEGDVVQLQVRLHHGTEEKVLIFPLKLAAG